jgi:glyoxylase-like metal-dependent hydrolase (beta-lactamase superfamily II)
MRYRIHPSNISRKLHNLEKITLGKRMLTVYHTPGETPGSICLYDNKYGLLFTGDTFYPGTLWPYLEESELEVYLLLGVVTDFTTVSGNLLGTN